jgi:hypothetical protein
VSLGQLTHGLTRHRAVLFKFLCGLPGVDIPCKLMQLRHPDAAAQVGEGMMMMMMMVVMMMRLNGGDDDDHRQDQVVVDR